MALIFLMKFVQQNVNVTLCPKQNKQKWVSPLSKVQQASLDQLLHVWAFLRPGEWE